MARPALEPGMTEAQCGLDSVLHRPPWASTCLSDPDLVLWQPKTYPDSEVTVDPFQPAEC